MISIKALCEQLNALERHSEMVSENINDFYAQGTMTIDVQAIIKKIIDVVGKQLQSFVILNVDGGRVFFSEFSDFDDCLARGQHSIEFELTVEKKRLIQHRYLADSDIDEIFYTSLFAFQSTQNGLGLKTPLLGGTINQDYLTRIHVFGLEQAFGGPRLLVVPVESNAHLDRWPSDSQLPTHTGIHRKIHVVSPEHIIVNPRQFELSWGALDSEVASPFRLAYAQHLLVALCTTYCADDRVELKWDWVASIVSAGLTVDADMMAALADCVKWCYEPEIPAERIHLLIDCLFAESSIENLLRLTGKELRKALERAKQQVIISRLAYEGGFDPEAYTITIRREVCCDELLYVGRVAEFPGIRAFEDTYGEAHALILDAIETLKAIAEEDHNEFPVPYVNFAVFRKSSEE